MLVFIVCGYLHRCNRKFTKVFNCWLVFVLMLLILLVLSLSARQDQTCLCLGRAEYDISVFKQFAAWFVQFLHFCSALSVDVITLSVDVIAALLTLWLS